jgi:hypothetical protein
MEYLWGGDEDENFKYLDDVDFMEKAEVRETTKLKGE